MGIVIRPSSLSMWPDCKRRSAARMFPMQVREAGFELRQLSPSVGASVGSATHSAVAYAMTEKMEKGTLPPNSAAEDAGMAELTKRIGNEGVQWDQTTPNLGTAQKQVVRQYRSYRLHLADALEPVAVERRINVKTRRGNTLSGQIDLTTNGIRDVKTGTTSRSNHGQYGGYSMLRRSEGGHVDHVIEDFVQRVPIDKPQPPPVELEYDSDLCEQVASIIIHDVEEHYERFVETGDPLTFMANPNSVLCMERYCPAWGTKFCKEWRR